MSDSYFFFSIIFVFIMLKIWTEVCYVPHGDNKQISNHLQKINFVNFFRSAIPKLWVVIFYDFSPKWARHTSRGGGLFPYGNDHPSGSTQGLFGTFFLVRKSRKIAFKEVVSKTGHWGGLTVSHNKKWQRGRMITGVSGLVRCEALM